MRLARLGCNIAVHYHTANDIANELVKDMRSLGVEAKAFGADLSNYDGVRQLHSQVTESLGQLDILFNNAGVTVKTVGADGNIEDVSPEEFEVTWRNNTGTHYLVR